MRCSSTLLLLSAVLLVMNLPPGVAPKKKKKTSSKGLDNLQQALQDEADRNQNQVDERKKYRTKQRALVESITILKGFNENSVPAKTTKLPELGLKDEVVDVAEAAEVCEADLRCGGFLVRTGRAATFYGSVGTRLQFPRGSDKSRGWTTYRVKSRDFVLAEGRPAFAKKPASDGEIPKKDALERWRNIAAKWRENELSLTDWYTDLEWPFDLKKVTAVSFGSDGDQVLASRVLDLVNLVSDEVAGGGWVTVVNLNSTKPPSPTEDPTLEVDDPPRFFHSRTMTERCCDLDGDETEDFLAKRMAGSFAEVDELDWDADCEALEKNFVQRGRPFKVRAPPGFPRLGMDEAWAEEGNKWQVNFFDPVRKADMVADVGAVKADSGSPFREGGEAAFQAWRGAETPRHGNLIHRRCPGLLAHLEDTSELRIHRNGTGFTPRSSTSDGDVLHVLGSGRLDLVLLRTDPPPDLLSAVTCSEVCSKSGGYGAMSAASFWRQFMGPQMAHMPGTRLAALAQPGEALYLPARTPAGAVAAEDTVRWKLAAKPKKKKKATP